MENNCRRNVEDFILIWLDVSVNHGKDSASSMVSLRYLINTTEIFNDPDQCLNFIRGIREEKVFLIVSDSASENVISLFHAMPQLNSIYILCSDNQLDVYKHFNVLYDKTKGCFSTIASLVERIKMDMKRTENNITPVSIIDLKSFVPSFMYSKLFQEILLTTNWINEEAKHKLVQFCRQEYINNPEQLRIIDEFDRDYKNHSPVWWYTRECFLYKMLNKALRTQDLDILWIMGFFMHDLNHEVIERCSNSSAPTNILLYRGQLMLNDEFDKLKNNEGGFLSFTNFLSTSTDRTVALFFADEEENTPAGYQAVLFEMEIGYSNHYVPFTSLDSLSYFGSEQEYLFSTHTVFRIGNSIQMTNGVWQVKLKLVTEDADTDLRLLMERVRSDITDTTGHLRLEYLTFKMGEWEKARELYEGLLERTLPEDTEKLASFSHDLANIYKELGDLEQSIAYFQKSFDLKLTYLSEDDPQMADMHSDFGVVLKAQGKLDEAIEHYQRSIQLELKSSEPNQEKIAKNYTHIGAVLLIQRYFLKGRENLEQALKIQLNCLPPIHLQLAITHNYLFHICYHLEEYSTALTHAKSCLEINQKLLPWHSPRIANAHNNVALCLYIIGEHNDALQHQEQAVKLACHTLPLDHPQTKSFQEQLDLIHSLISK